MKNDRPHVTVAAVIEQNGRFLMVEEQPEGRVVLNQPAGHIEPGETPQQAVVREVLEESGYHFLPEVLVGIYSWTRKGDRRSYVRLCFAGHCSEGGTGKPLDEAILTTHWMSRDELAAEPGRLRSPMVLACIDDYLAGQSYPLGLINIL